MQSRGPWFDRHLAATLFLAAFALPQISSGQAEASRKPTKLQLVDGDSITGTVSGVKDGSVSVITDYGVIRVPVLRLTEASRKDLGISSTATVEQLQKRVTELEALVERLRTENSEIRKQQAATPATPMVPAGVQSLVGGGGSAPPATSTSPSSKWHLVLGQRHRQATQRTVPLLWNEQGSAGNCFGRRSVKSLRRMKLLLVICGLAACFGSALAEAPRTLRVVTWNLQWFPGGKPGATKETQDHHIEIIREGVRKLDPDILMLEEVGSEGALAEMLKPLGDDWKIAIISRFNDGNFRSGQQVAIAAKMPAESAWAEPWQKGWAGAPRGYAYASFLIGGKRLAVYALHLKSNLGEPAMNTSKREDAMAQLLAHIDSKEQRVLPAVATIIAGDFNTDDPDSPAALSPGERSFHLMRKEGFFWAFEGIAHVDRITCPSKGRYPPASFDHFWTRGLGKPLSSVSATVGSDHLPVVLEISL